MRNTELSITVAIRVQLSHNSVRDSVLPALFLLVSSCFDQAQYGFFLIVMVALLILRWVHHLQLEYRFNVG